MPIRIVASSFRVSYPVKYLLTSISQSLQALLILELLLSRVSTPPRLENMLTWIAPRPPSQEADEAATHTVKRLTHLTRSGRLSLPDETATASIAEKHRVTWIDRGVLILELLF